MPRNGVLIITAALSLPTFHFDVSRFRVALTGILVFSQHLTYLVLHFILFYNVVGFGKFDMLIRSCDDDGPPPPFFFFSIWLCKEFL